MIIDIGSSGGGIFENALSNFSHLPFNFRGFEAASMEGLLQSLKFENPVEQVMVMGMWGKRAKFKGKKRNKKWKKEQALWWQGERMERKSREYQEFLDEAFRSLYMGNKKAGVILLATGEAELIHSIGKKRREETVLTEEEFVVRLLWLRGRLKELKERKEEGR
jgi:hypothetical protein